MYPRGRVYLNPEASEDGFNFIVKNPSSALITVNRFGFESEEGKNRSGNSFEYPFHSSLRQNRILRDGESSGLRIPWKSVVLDALYAGYRRQVDAGKDFRYYLIAHDEYNNKTYRSKALCHFKIYNYGLRHFGETLGITPEEFETVGWEFRDGGIRNMARHFRGRS